MIFHDGKVALKSFLPTVFIFLAIFLLPRNLNNLMLYQYNQFLNPFLYYVIVNITLYITHNKIDFQIALRAALLAQIFAMGIYIFAYCPRNVYIFGMYMSVISFFHYSEYLTIAIIKPKELSTKSFMLSHSPAYIAAAMCSWLEFALESYFFPSMKQFPCLPFVGLIFCILGEVVRKLAMFTASKNFDHLDYTKPSLSLICLMKVLCYRNALQLSNKTFLTENHFVVQHTKADDHMLVTHGIYNWCRHPSYVGWFYWSLGTQILLLNPICVILYAVLSWKFFNDRIYYEEIILLNFFGMEYCNYQQNVGTGLPFINGYIVRP